MAHLRGVRQLLALAAGIPAAPVFLDTGESAERYLHKERTAHALDDLAIGDALITEQALDQRPAGTAAAGAHPGAGHRLDLIRVPVAFTDQGADLARRH